MKKVRKGFTLVELLIVIAIIGALSATMSVTMSGSTAKAKAAAIVSNVDACKSAANLYALNTTEDVSTKKADDVLKASLSTWVDFSDGNITYKGTEDTDSDKWAITVDFSGDPEKVAIRDALKNIKGYNKYNKATTTTNEGVSTTTYAAADIFGDSDYSFKVTLTTGKIEPVSSGS